MTRHRLTPEEPKRAELTVVAGLAGALCLSIASAACESFDFQRIDLGADKRGEAHERSSEQYVRALYADLLNRAPAVRQLAVTAADGTESTLQLNERSILVAALEGVGDPTPVRRLIAAGLVGSPEAGLPGRDEVPDPQAFIVEQFERLLGREPAAEELASFVWEWNEDAALTPATVVQAIVGSREYQSQWSVEVTPP
jgi:hypothetical protein